MSFTWLHISDFHIRGGDSYDRDVVLKALVRSVKQFHETKGHKPDLIFATGDIAHGGKVAEYIPATEFFDALLEAAALERRHLFVVPGNHDVDRDESDGLASTLETEEKSTAYFKSGKPLKHIIYKLGAFRDWYNGYFDGIRKLPDDTTCDLVDVVDIRGQRVAVLQLNTALFSMGGDEDYHKLVLGRRSLQPALEEIQKLNVDLKIGLLHHPLDWLGDFERSNIKSALQGALDLLLRGHLHDTEVENVVSVSGALLHIGAGAAYQTRKWHNRSLYCTFHDGSVTVFPIRYEDHPHEIWTVDPSVFPNEINFESSFVISRFTPSATRTFPLFPLGPHSSPVFRTFRSNIPPKGDLPIVGRNQLLGEIETTLGDPSMECVLVLHGAPGTGKSELAREYARRNRNRYPGGTFFIHTGSGAELVDLARIATNVLGLEFPEGLSLKGQCERTLLYFGSEPILLVYDNVWNQEALMQWLPPSGMPCHVLVTTVNENWAAPWKMLPVPPLKHDDAFELIERLGGTDIARLHGKELVRMAQGLPIQIVPASRTLAYESRRGRLESARINITSEAQNSFRYVYEVLENPVRLLLHAAAFLNGERIVRTELFVHLETAYNNNAREFERRLDVCLDLHLLENAGDLRMHQLFAIYLKGVELSLDIRKLLVKIRLRQKERFIELGKSVSEHPADREQVAAFLSYNLRLESWDNGELISTEEGEAVGRALCEIGRFNEARPWFERAVAAKGQGDLHGRIDHASLGTSLHNVGYCFSSVGKYDDARSWLERAVAAKELGDLHGRIDHESLGSSLHRVGHSLSSAGKFDEARPWYERAVAAAEQGDVYGHINHESLGRSLHQVGYSLFREGKFDEARLWFERAVAAAEQGDVYGRIDHESLGRSLHQVAHSLSSLGKFDEARSWFERAVVAKEQGDVHGRISHESIGTSLHYIGNSLFNVGKFDEARPWFERAVVAKEQGNVHGRISHENLGTSLHMVGDSLSRVGRYDEARLWYERAVATKEHGDEHGRFIPESLGMSRRAVALCLRAIGKFDEAQNWEDTAIPVQNEQSC